jgi:CxxC-x17-CxxC domain-containing protein
VYNDRSLACVDCGQEFSFTAGEQEFYAQRGFTESPKRCPSCRQIRKAQRSRSSSSDGAGAGGGDSYGGGSYATNDYGGYSASGGDSSGGSGGGGGGGGGYSSGGGGGYSERRPREMFEAVCANCGRTASVPFRPSGSKPVYCSDCFESRR